LGLNKRHITDLNVRFIDQFPQEIKMITWISDGSIVKWHDTIKLEGVCKVDKLGLNNNQSYEGLVDKNVAINDLTIPWQESGLDAEAEWVLVFEKPLHEIDNISENTGCWLEGMIEGKWMKPMLVEGEIDWGPASIGNNVMTHGKNIKLKLGDFVSDNSFPQYSITVKFCSAAGDEVTHKTSTKDLRGIPIVELVQAVKDKTPNEIKVQAVNLGANGRKAAYVNESHNKLLSFIKAVPSLFTEHPDIINKARLELFKELIEDKEYIPSQGAATLQVFDQNDTIKSSCTLKLS
jgi:hypothetical protein